MELNIEELVTKQIKKEFDRIDIEQIVSDTIIEQFKDRIEKALDNSAARLTKEYVDTEINTLITEYLKNKVTVSDGWSNKTYDSLESFFRIKLKESLTASDISRMFDRTVKEEISKYLSSQSKAISDTMFEQFKTVVSAVTVK